MDLHTPTRIFTGIIRVIRGCINSLLLSLSRFFPSPGILGNWNETTVTFNLTLIIRPVNMQPNNHRHTAYHPSYSDYSFGQDKAKIMGLHLH